ncbi:alkaline phosphatase family protein [Sorangium sp. So ce834]|uniref:alkaline phosphatase family protein n=1 Tax=Sorangium sp. So ce834 TaxID=3133321 RepID=UPI003F61C49F
MKSIEHVVLVILENRSFDSVLGWLYADPSAGPALNIPEPAPGERRFEGLAGLDPAAFTNVAEGLSCAPVKGASAMNVPCVAPNEEFASVNVQLFGQEDVRPGDTPTMKGFVQDYMAALKKSGIADRAPDALRDLAGEVMESYTPDQLPVINGLAEHYAVCDMWFSSVPSQTNPNRAFAFCGTSLGLTDNGWLEKDPRAELVQEKVGYRLGDDQFETTTLWNALHEAGHDDWAIFWQTSTLPEKISIALTGGKTRLQPLIEHIVQFAEDLDADHQKYLVELSSGDLPSCYTYRLFPGLRAIPGVERRFARVERFHEQARAGALPRFSVIEPFWTVSQASTDLTWEQSLATALGNDYHPPGNLSAGETFLQSVYMSLIANRAAWEKTLLIVTFDEGVGTFDHVPPPAAVPPWGRGGSAPATQHGFDFARHGVRVPAILVSPRIRRGTVFRSTRDQPYDHTSLIATILKWYGEERRLPAFQQRAMGAPTFEEVLTLEEPRRDERDVRFLQVKREPGQPLKYLDRFTLRSHAGERVSAAARKSTILGLLSLSDPKVAEYFPTLGGEAVQLFLEKSAREASAGKVRDGDEVALVSTEVEIGAYNTLGAWSLTGDCYYFNDYDPAVDEDRYEKQTWVLEAVEKGRPVQFGDAVAFRNKRSGAYLAPDGNGVKTHRSAYHWIIEPITSPPDAQRGSAAANRQ